MRVRSLSRDGPIKEAITGAVAAGLDPVARDFLNGASPAIVDFTKPEGEAALTGPDSVSWRIFKNPVALFIGGVAAVLLEFAEPRVRTGVWEHSTFRSDPVARLKRTGLAAMITVYGARSRAEQMIAGVRRMHRKVRGETPAGDAYAADDPALLDWVHATASFGFVEAYAAYVQPLSDAERDRFYAEGAATAALYGATGAPTSLAAQRALFAATFPRFERSDIVFEFLAIMRRAKALPQPVRLMQGAFVRAAIDIVPAEARAVLGLDEGFGLRPLERRLIKRLGRRADRMVLKSGPPAQACERLGLARDYLYRAR